MTTNLYSTLAILATICIFQCITVDSCSCPPPEYVKRNVGCKDEFIAIVNITGTILTDLKRTYSFNLIEDFTPQLASHRSLSHFKTISTGIYEAVCGVNLNVNTVYLIKGRLAEEPSIALCQVYAQLLPQVPTKAASKELFSKLYKQIC